MKTKSNRAITLGAFLAGISIFASACGGNPATPAPTVSAPTIESPTTAPATTAAETPTAESSTSTTEPLTDTGSLTGTTTTTGTGTLTDTGTLTSSTDLTDTTGMTDTGTMTSTTDMTGTGSMTDTGTMTGTGSMTDTTGMSSDKDIVQVATEAGNFKTLTALLTAAGLDETLKGNGPFTVFAPTDEAFAKLPQATLDDLMKPESKDKLVKILNYHVVKGKVMAADVATMTSSTTVEGSDLKIKASGSDVMIDSAKVITPDIVASNGVIHVIDTVLMPPTQ